MSDRVRIDLYQDGQRVASVDAPKADAIREIRHYAFMYGQDGPVTIKVKRGNVDLREVFAVPTQQSVGEG